MQLNLHQIAALSEMGIPVWQLRPVVKENDEDSERVDSEKTAIAAGDIPAASDWVVLPTTLLSEAEQRLLTAMLKAIKIDIGRVAVVDEQQFQALLEHIPSNKRLFLCGVSPAALTAGELGQLARTATGAMMIASHGLPELLQNPVLKRDAWHALQLYATLSAESD